MNSYEIKDDRVYVTLSYGQRELAKTIDGFHWHGHDKVNPRKAWSWKVSMETINTLNDYFNLGIMEGSKPNIAMTTNDLEVIDKRNDMELLSYDTPIKPFEFQRRAVTYMMEYKQHGLFLTMGLGKTKCVIDFFFLAKKERKVDKLLVVAPKSCIVSWLEELEKHGVDDFIVLEGSKEKRLKQLDEDVCIYILNYAGIIVLRNELGRKFNNDRTVIALDESSMIKSPGAERTRIIIKTFVNNIFKFCLSGTPITQSPIDIYSQFKFLNPTFFSVQSYYSFRNYYCIMGDGFNNAGNRYQKIIGYRKLPELKTIINRHSYILKKEDCKYLGLPEKIYEKRELEMLGGMKEQYDQMRKHLILEIENDIKITASIMIVKMLRLQQIMSGCWLENQKDNTKLKELMDIIKNYSGNQKVIVWCRFIDSLKLIAAELNKNGIDNVLFYGETRDRKGTIEMFRNNPSCKVFIGQLRTGGKGINLQCASMVIYFENSFSLEDRLQSEDRCHRPGQVNNVTYIDMIYKGTIDEQIIKAIKNKEKIADYLIEGMKKVQV